MSEIRTFPTKRAAQQVIKGMHGCRADVTRLIIPDDENADKHGFVWVIRLVGGHVGTKHLREDGTFG